MTQPVSPVQITLDQLTYTQQERVILDGLSLEIAAPRIGVIGRNGSGKTTLSRMVAGLIAPTSGAVRLGDMDPAKDRKAALRTVGILFQNPDHQIIFPTVIEELCFGLTQMGHTKQQAHEQALAQLAQFDLTHWADAHVSTLSQGQKQLLCLMSILAMGPQMLILDEPFSGLDIPTRRQLARRLASYAGAVMHVTHAPEDVAQYDQVIWLDQGVIKQVGPAQEVLPVFTQTMERMGAGDDLSDLSG